MIAIEVDRYEGVPGYESWWDVPVAEVSEVHRRTSTLAKATRKPGGSS